MEWNLILGSVVIGQLISSLAGLIGNRGKRVRTLERAVRDYWRYAVKVEKKAEEMDCDTSGWPDPPHYPL